MRKHQTWIVLILISFAVVSKGDLQKARTYTHPKSRCIVKTTAGEYPLFSVHKGTKVIFKPKTDGIAKILYSPSGQYIAFGSSETGPIDIVKNWFHLVVVNCEKATVKGWNIDEKGMVAAWPLSWTKDNTSLQYGYLAYDETTRRENNGTNKIIFDELNSLP